MLTVVRDERKAEAARAALEHAAERARVAGHDARTEVTTGDAGDRILATAASSGAGMIVMASHGRGAVGRLIHGSVADRVAREATVPTMIVRADVAAPGPVGITRLVVPLDGSPLAEQSLPFAAAISRRLGTPLFLVRAVSSAELMPPAVGMGEAIPFELYDEAETEMEQEARAYLDGVAKRLRDQGLSVATEVLHRRGGVGDRGSYALRRRGRPLLARAHGREALAAGERGRDAGARGPGAGHSRAGVEQRVGRGPGMPQPERSGRGIVAAAAC